MGARATEPTASKGSARQGEENGKVTAEKTVARGPRQAQAGREGAG